MSAICDSAIATGKFEAMLSVRCNRECRNIHAKRVQSVRVPLPVRDGLR